MQKKNETKQQPKEFLIPKNICKRKIKPRIIYIRPPSQKGGNAFLRDGKPKVKKNKCRLSKQDKVVRTIYLEYIQDEIKKAKREKRLDDLAEFEAKRVRVLREFGLV